jgi:oligopeptide/dipeptide ABC transporter ATP-binding protein
MSILRLSGRKHVVPAEGTIHAPSGRVLLDVDGLATYFNTPRGTVKAVDGVSFTLDRGRTLGLVGESGCGKSVLSRSIMGLLPSRNVTRKGEIGFDGHRLDQMGPAEMRSFWGTQLAMVFQDPMTSLNPVMRIGKQITESLDFHFDMDRSEAQETALALLKSVNIPEPARRLRQYPHELSGGMRQRVVIAVALACGPKLLFADEPTTALDVTIQAQYLDLLKEVQRSTGVAIILVTHDFGIVAANADRVAVMYAGRIVEMGSTLQVFNAPAHPYTQALLRCLPDAALQRQRLVEIGGQPPDLAQLPPGCPFAPRCPKRQPICEEAYPPIVALEDGHVAHCWMATAAA